MLLYSIQLLELENGLKEGVGIGQASGAVIVPLYWPV